VCISLLYAMTVQIRLLPGAISDLFAQVSSSGKITLADRYGLMAALLEDALAEEERDAIDRLLRAFCRGRMKVVSEISALSDHSLFYQSYELAQVKTIWGANNTPVSVLIS
jgi:hypothetical protein